MIPGKAAAWEAQRPRPCSLLFHKHLTRTPLSRSNSRRDPSCGCAILQLVTSSPLFYLVPVRSSLLPCRSFFPGKEIADGVRR